MSALRRERQWQDRKANLHLSYKKREKSGRKNERKWKNEWPTEKVAFTNLRSLRIAWVCIRWRPVESDKICLTCVSIDLNINEKAQTSRLRVEEYLRKWWHDWDSGLGRMHRRDQVY